MRGEIIIKDIRITARVTEKQRRRIAVNAKRCGLSQSEYIKQRSLGYEPRAAAPDTYFALCERIDALADIAGTPLCAGAVTATWAETAISAAAQKAPGRLGAVIEGNGTS